MRLTTFQQTILQITAILILHTQVPAEAADTVAADTAVAVTQALTALQVTVAKQVLLNPQKVIQAQANLIHPLLLKLGKVKKLMIYQISNKPIF